MWFCNRIFKPKKIQKINLNQKTLILILNINILLDIDTTVGDLIKFHKGNSCGIPNIFQDTLKYIDSCPEAFQYRFAIYQECILSKEIAKVKAEQEAARLEEARMEEAQARAQEEAKEKSSKAKNLLCTCT